MNQNQEFDFRNHLAKYFGFEIVKKILKPNTLEFEDYLQSILRENKITPKICDHCSLNVKKKRMDFPAWLGDLNNNSPHRKDVLILGISPSGLKFPIQIAYGLGYNYFSEEDLINLKGGAIKFWNVLRYLFGDNFNALPNNLYITDLANCNCTSKDKNTLKFCFSKGKLEEIEFINPKLLIMHSYIVYSYFKKWSKPLPFIAIPHIQGKPINNPNSDYYFNFNDFDNQNTFWKEAKEFITSLLY